MTKYLEMLYEGKYDELVTSALPVLDTDAEAKCAFLRLFMARDIMFLLDFDISIEPLIKEAEAGNKYAQYAYARWQTLVRGGENSIAIAYHNMKAAAEQGLPDAIAGLAITYEFGDIGQVDWDKEDELLDRALEMGSELAAKYKLQDYCFGRHYQDAKLYKAIDLTDQLIARDFANGTDPNGWWYYYRAVAQEERLGRTRVAEDYQRAYKLGVLYACTDLIFAAGYGDSDTTLVETKEYIEYLNEGMNRLCSGAFFLDAAREMKRYDTFEELYHEEDGVQRHKLRYNLMQQCHNRIFSRLSQAAELGDCAAWEQLGDCYKDGLYDFEKDDKKAFVCYSNGTIHDSRSCVEKLWKMMHDHLIDRPLDYVDSIALKGARCGSKRLLAETVIIHQEGRLTEYDEITRFYDPIFDAPEFTLDNNEDWREVIDELFGDDDPDDDGRYDAWA
ncbi:MAG: sel1 repeat family protein [Paludibacteraceae bacterium]|nr:sel1 repeat family protein [Paludibacteraceae bacterium]